MLKKWMILKNNSLKIKNKVFELFDFKLVKKIR